MKSTKFVPQALLLCNVIAVKNLFHEHCSRVRSNELFVPRSLIRVSMELQKFCKQWTTWFETYELPSKTQLNLPKKPYKCVEQLIWGSVETSYHRYYHRYRFREFNAKVANLGILGSQMLAKKHNELKPHRGRLPFHPPRFVSDVITLLWGPHRAKSLIKWHWVVECYYGPVADIAVVMIWWTS